MSAQSARSIRMYNKKVYGIEISKYGLENGYLDYLTLANIVGHRILNNSILNNDFELLYGKEAFGLDIDGNECDPDDPHCYGMAYYDIYQYYMITENGAEFLNEYTDEIVYYNHELDVYLWGITHFGTSWDYVLTDIKLVDGDK